MTIDVPEPGLDPAPVPRSPDLAGRVAVVTGATGGLGAATARVLVAHGARVVVAGRREAPGVALAAELGSAAHFHRTDVAQERQVRELIEVTLDRFGRLDCLVNNAGDGGTLGPIEDLDLERFGRTLAVHVLGMAAGIKHAAGPMTRQGSGSIINVASVSGFVAGWSPMDYSVAKAAVLHLTRCAAVELGEYGVRVNSVSPGPIPTGIQLRTTGADAETAERAAPALKRLFADALRPWQPIRRVGEPDDVASAIAWLASDSATFVNGQDLAIDGGLRAGRPGSVSAATYARLSTLLGG